MTNGIRFTNGSNQRVIDEAYMVPEFIGKISLNTTPIFNARQGIAPYTTRTYSASLPNSNGRDMMIFWTLPSNGTADVWYSFPARAVAGDTTTGITMLIGNGASPGPLPVGYVFAVGNATYGSDRYGIRLWDGTGKLILDSGSQQLNVNTIITGISITIDVPQTKVLSVPLNAAYLLPNTYYVYDHETPNSDETRFDAISDQMFGVYSVRRNGTTLYNMCPIYAKYYYEGGQSYNDYTDNVFYGNSTGLIIPVIDGSQYD